MPQFRYEVRDKAGKVLRGVIDAPTDTEARSRLMSRGYFVNTMIAAGNQPAQAAPRVGTPPPQAVAGPIHWTTAPPKEMAVFFRGLESSLKSGVLMLKAITDIGNQTPSRNLRSICQTLATHLNAGHQLSSAMAQFPRAFPPHVVGVVAAGELGGFLAVVIGDLALDYELAQRATVRAGKMWLWVLWINALLTIPLIPIPPMLFSSGSTLESLWPGFIHGMQFSLKYLVVPMVVLLTVYFTTMAVLRLPSMRLVAGRLILKVPWAGRASRDRSLASFSRLLWRLQEAGIAPIQSWDAASRAAENLWVSAQLYSQLYAVRSGRRLSEAIMATNLFSSQDTRVVAMGESSGQLPETLQRMSVYYEDAATVSLGKAKWIALRIAIIANIIVLGAAAISITLVEPAIMKFVESQFLVE